MLLFQGVNFYQPAMREPITPSILRASETIASTSGLTISR